MTEHANSIQNRVVSIFNYINKKKITNQLVAFKKLESQLKGVKINLIEQNPPFIPNLNLLIFLGNNAIFKQLESGANSLAGEIL